MADEYTMGFVKFFLYAAVFDSVKKEINRWDDRLSEVDDKIDHFRRHSMDRLLTAASEHETDDIAYPTCFSVVKPLARLYITIPILKLDPNLDRIFEIRDNAKNNFDFAFNAYKTMIEPCGYDSGIQAIYDAYCKFTGNRCYKSLFKPKLTSWGFALLWDDTNYLAEMYREFRSNFTGHRSIPREDCDVNDLLVAENPIDEWILTWHTSRARFEAEVATVMDDIVGLNEEYAAMEEVRYAELGPCMPIERNQ